MTQQQSCRVAKRTAFRGVLAASCLAAFVSMPAAAQGVNDFLHGINNALNNVNSALAGVSQPGATGRPVTPALTARPKSVDVTPFDIAGITLGMTEQQAVAAVTSKLNLSQRDIRITRGTIHGVGMENAASDILIRKNGIEISVSLMRDALHDRPGTTVVSQINYRVPYTVANNAEVLKKALAKYGAPTFGDARSARWCMLENPYFCSETLGNLEVGSAGISIRDFRYRNAVIRYNDQQQRTESVF